MPGKSRLGVVSIGITGGEDIRGNGGVKTSKNALLRKSDENKGKSGQNPLLLSSAN